jgi:hypothetical protein
MSKRKFNFTTSKRKSSKFLSILDDPFLIEHEKELRVSGAYDDIDDSTTDVANQQTGSSAACILSTPAVSIDTCFGADADQILPKIAIYDFDFNPDLDTDIIDLHSANMSIHIDTAAFAAPFSNTSIDDMIEADLALLTQIGLTPATHDAKVLSERTNNLNSTSNDRKWVNRVASSSQGTLKRSLTI